MTTDLAGLRVLITGPARGIGADLSRALAARGSRLALVGLEPRRLEELAAELGGGAVAIECDVRDLAALRAAADRAAEALGGLDVVVANAGVAYGTTADAEGDDERERVTLEVNLLGPMRTVRATLPHITASRGQYVLIASLASMIQMPLLGAYSASKAGVHAYGNALRQELAPRGVAVTVAYFGFIDTDMGRLAGDSGAMNVFTRHIPGPLSHLHPVRVAVAALLRAIERRSRRAIAPGAVLPAVLLPALHQWVSEKATARRVSEALTTAAVEPALHAGSTPGLATPVEVPPAAAPPERKASAVGGR